MLNLGVLCSGSGTNLQAILDACANQSLDAQVKLVLCNKPGASALERALRAGVPSQVLSHKDIPSREEYDARLVTLLQEYQVDTVVLAGFLRIVTPVLLDAFPDRVINIHPALLPSFPGLDGQQQALNYGVVLTGCTVHLVDAGMDTGPILAQAAVPIFEEDDRETLVQRVLRQEHRLLVEVLRWFAEKRIKITRIDGKRPRIYVQGRPRAFWSNDR